MDYWQPSANRQPVVSCLVCAGHLTVHAHPTPATPAFLLTHTLSQQILSAAFWSLVSCIACMQHNTVQHNTCQPEEERQHNQHCCCTACTSRRSTKRTPIHSMMLQRQHDVAQARLAEVYAAT